jgi:hypothetical protein
MKFLQAHNPSLLETGSHLATLIMGANSAIDLHSRMKRKKRNPIPVAEDVNEFNEPVLLFAVAENVFARASKTPEGWILTTVDGEGMPLDLDVSEEVERSIGAYLDARANPFFTSEDTKHAKRVKHLGAGTWKGASVLYGGKPAKVLYSGNDPETGERLLAIEQGKKQYVVRLNEVVLNPQRNSYKRTPQTSLHVHDYEREYASGTEGEVTDYYRGRRGKGAHPKVFPTPRANADNPSCPHCGQYNAMLFDRLVESAGVEGYVLKCRNCGFEEALLFDSDESGQGLQRNGAFIDGIAQGAGFGVGTGIVAAGVIALHHKFKDKFPKLENNPRLTGGKWSNEADATRLDKLEAQRSEVYRALDNALRHGLPQSAVRAYTRKLEQLERRIARQRGKIAANPQTSRTPSIINKNSRMFHGAHNKSFGKSRIIKVSNYVRAEHASRLGGLPYIKLLNPFPGESRRAHCQDVKHACNECSIRMNPQTSWLGLTGNKKLIIGGQGVHQQGRALRQSLVRMNPDLADKVIDLGEIEVTGYLTPEKHSDSQEMILYYHPTAEETGRTEDMPHLKLDEEGMFFLPTTGADAGAYTCDERGIIN